MADLTLSLTQMDEWLCRGIWGVTRLGSALMIMPLTGDLVPATLRLVIAIALVLPIFPTITLPQPGIAAFSAEAILITAGELLTGPGTGLYPRPLPVAVCPGGKPGSHADGVGHGATE